MPTNSFWSQPGATSKSSVGGQPASAPPPLLHQCQNPAPLNPAPNPSSSSSSSVNHHFSSSITTVSRTHSTSLDDKFEVPHQSVTFIDSIKVTFTSQRHASSASSEGATKPNGSYKRLVAPRIADKRSRTLSVNHGDQTRSRSSKDREIEIIELGEPIETSDVKPIIIDEKNPVITEDRPKKKLRRHENCEIELFSDDLRVVVFHPDQQMVRRENVVSL